MAIPQYSDEVLVTLTSINPQSSLPYPDRRIFLSKDVPSMTIGRTSKRNSELGAAEGNCWFDSAVMSRDHAKLQFDAPGHKVLIKDEGSLHGTFFNDHLLEARQSKALRDGDILKFGIPIDRERETFNPCTVEVKMQFGSSRPEERPRPGVFRVPDDTDAEISSDDDVEVQYCTQVLRQHDIAPARSPGMNSDPIDLTGPEPQAPLVVHAQLPPTSVLPSMGSSYNATSPCPDGAAVVDLTSSDSSHEGNKDPYAQMWTYERPPELSDQVNTVQNDQFPNHEDDEVFNLSDSEGSFSDAYSSASSVSADSAGEPLFVDEDDEFEEHDEFEEGHSNPSEADGSDESEDEGCASRPSAPQSMTTTTAPDYGTSWEDRFKAHQMDPYQLPLPPMGSSYESILSCTPAHLVQTRPLVQSSGVRLPSIHEAVSNTPISTPHSQPFAEAMGAKTGKFDYFAAREENKTNVQAQVPAPADIAEAPVSQKANYADAIEEESLGCSRAASLSPGSEGLDSASSIPELGQLDDKVAGPSGSLLESGTKFLNSPHALVDLEEPSSAADAVLDETSAFLFEMSKQVAETLETSRNEMEVDSDTKIKEASATKRTHMGINDLLDVAEAAAEAAAASELSQVSAAGSQDGRLSLKRKAADISKLTPAEEAKDTGSHLSASATIATALTPAHPVLAGLAAVSIDPDTKRATRRRRLRRVAEVVGIAAFGGAAVMGALIATAPAL